MKVGKNLFFDVDFPFLPPLQRSEESVSEAQNAIVLPDDQLRYAMFWYSKQTPIDDLAFNLLKCNNTRDAEGLWMNNISMSSLLNLIVCSIISQNNIAIASYADMLFQTYGDKFCSLINETIKHSSKELTEIFIDSLLEEGYDISSFAKVSTSSDVWKEVVASRACGPIIASIQNEIDKSKRANNSSAFYMAGHHLINSTKEMLRQLKDLIGSSDVQYKMIADKLAQAILQCGINYFNGSNEDDAPQKAMVIQSYALSIAEGKMVRDRCQENVNILKDIGPEFKIRVEMSVISSKIDKFKSDSKYPTSSGRVIAFTIIESFINDCKPVLQAIKSKIGNDSSLYLNISSAVVSTAINGIVETINSAQLLPRSMASSLKENVSKAITLMMMIGSTMDMNPNCRAYYTKNSSTLSSIRSQLNKQQPSEGCYIATMVYGDYDHPQVMKLRWFRDEVLDHYQWGKDFIRFYYKHSPSWVERLKSHKYINAAIRICLDAFIKLLNKLHIMNKLIIIIGFLISGLTCNAQATDTDLSSISQQIEQLRNETRSQIDAKTSHLQKEVNAIQGKLNTLEQQNDSMHLDLTKQIKSNAELTQSYRDTTSVKIKAVESNSKSSLHSVTTWGLILAVVILLITLIGYVILRKGLSKGIDSISAIRKAQESLQEESVKLDTKLVELLDKQLDVAKVDGDVSNTQAEAPDHSLALKIADEVARIEKNLSRMDTTIKGFKSLTRAIERIKDNFKANGYEIVTYLGQKYNEGMRVDADFIIDEELPEGSRIITSVSKAQVHYNGQLIQKANITVSQNI
jgi:hypothetical protein